MKQNGLLFVLTMVCASAHTATVSLSAQTNSPAEGFAEPLHSVVVASSDAGVLYSVEIREGDFVKKGDIICRLDSRVLKALLRGAQAKLESKGKINAAQATLDNRVNHLKQMLELFDKQHASDKEVKQAQLDVDLAKSNLQTANDELRQHQMEVEQIQAQIERRIIRAPFDGVVLELPKQAGESVTASDYQVATVVNLRQLKVRYFLTTKQALTIKIGDQLPLHFPETRQTVNGTASFVSPVTDSNSGTVRVEITIDNADGKYRSGLRCILSSEKTGKFAKVRAGEK